MVWDFDSEMLLFLAMITAGVFLVPMESDPPYFSVIGAILIVAGIGLVYRKVKKK
jgi:LPXTG-motif cell wall-anchored protein